MRKGPIDPGLQPERTRLAWSRTSLAFAANGGLALHAGHRLDHWAWILPGAAVLGISLVVYGLGAARYRRVDTAIRAGRPVTGTTATVTVTAAAVLTVAVAATLLI
ncbi:MAG TPA: DUF202 domain-containing protein, partial [Yinghuangia sp.]|nr:DUF202 domain-containing protein [Yinghuangia sp.]